MRYKTLLLLLVTVAALGLAACCFATSSVIEGSVIENSTMPDGTGVAR